MKTKQFYNKEVLTIIQSRYGCSLDYIRKSIRGDRVGSVSILIKEEYHKLNDQVVKVISIEAQKL